ncbi:MAG: hypothetical protein GX922_07910, partial [Firmicutes bacterium]|nr:hypothetical protein [Bacillota bacterium]
MKKTRFVLLALVAALALMGAGYAAWTQSFNIGGTVKTGELFVEIAKGDTTVKLMTKDGVVEVTEGNAAQYSIKYPDITTESTDNDKQTLKSIHYDLDLIPGMQVISVITFENKGSMRTKPTAIVKDAPGDINILEFSVNGVRVKASGEQTKLQALADAIAEAVGVLGIGEVDAEAKTV